MTATAVNEADSARRRARIRLVITAAAVAAVDLATKVWASATLAGNPVDLPGPLDLRLGHNPGVAFGLGNRAPTWLVLVITGAIAAGIAVSAWRHAFPSTVAAGMIIGGAAANVIDRMEAGTVVDMLYLDFWPTFNGADIGITAGGALLVLAMWRASSEDTEADTDLVDGEHDRSGARP